jgi:hypothetical protein
MRGSAFRLVEKRDFIDVMGVAVNALDCFANVR